MESSRDKLTGRIIEGEDLWELEIVNRDGYECVGCAVAVKPYSYSLDNIQRPHFRLPRGTSHENDCDVDSEKKIVEAGKKKSVKNKLETAPGLSPSSLILIDERPIIDPNRSSKNSKEQNDSISQKEKAKDSSKEKVRARRAANTIRPICRAFIQFPYDRTLSLNIPNLDGDSYLTIFKKLNGIERFGVNKIFYGELSWKKEEFDEEYMMIFLSAGDWKESKLVNPYRVRVDWSTWSNRKKTVLKNELEVARQEAIEAKSKNSKTKERAYLFFIGEQDALETSIFNVSDYRLICVLNDEFRYPTLKLS